MMTGNAQIVSGENHFGKARQGFAEMRLGRGRINQGVGSGRGGRHDQVDDRLGVGREIGLGEVQGQVGGVVPHGPCDLNAVGKVLVFVDGLQEPEDVGDFLVRVIQGAGNHIHGES